MGAHSWGCRNLYRTKKTNYNKPYLVYRKDYCENLECTATIVDKCQLDVHHIDGDHLNNDIENLQTLCSNCHRLVTKLNMEYVNKIYHP
jgi:5-methylcytosine-specific restriction endonuclease McrA